MFWGFPSGSLEKNPSCNAGDPWEAGSSLSWEDPMKKEITTLSSILLWKIPWKEELLVGYSPWDHRESDTTEHAHTLISYA